MFRPSVQGPGKQRLSDVSFRQSCFSFASPTRLARPPFKDPPMREIKLKDLKQKSPTELLAFAEEHEVENASILRKQELMFAILKQLASRDIEIVGEGVVEVLQDGFGFLRSPDANYLAGPDDICIALANPAFRPEDRRYGRGPDPQPERGRTLFCSAQGQYDQFRSTGEDPPQGAFRQSDTALSAPAVE